MSFINDINSIYPIKITILAIPSITGTLSTSTTYDKYSYPLRELGWILMKSSTLYSFPKKNGRRTIIPYSIIT